MPAPGKSASPPGRPSVAVALAGASHPLPTVAVTVMTTVLAVAADNSAATCLLVGAAVLTGQLSIGWSNDYLDAARDERVGRTDKPVARGLVGRSLVGRAAVLAAAATLVLSFGLGWRAGGVQLSGVVCGWLYNARLKFTWWSALPFFVAFGGLPAVATLALPSHPWPPVEVMVAAGLIGVAAHFGNVLPDLDEDRRTGVLGLPHRLGRTVSAVTAIALACFATVAVAAVDADLGSPTVWTLLTIAGVVAAMGFVAVRRHDSSEGAFFATVAIAAIGVALIASSGALTG